MFEGFSNGVIETIRLAQQVARQSGSSVCGSEHLLFGLLSEEEGIASSSLRRLGLISEVVRKQLVGTSSHREGESDTIQFSKNAELALKQSVIGAKNNGSNNVDTAHLLLALIENSKGNAVLLLKRANIDLEKLEQCVLESMK